MKEWFSDNLRYFLLILALLVGIGAIVSGMKLYEHYSERAAGTGGPGSGDAVVIITEQEEAKTDESAGTGVKTGDDRPGDESETAGGRASETEAKAAVDETESVTVPETGTETAAEAATEAETAIEAVTETEIAVKTGMETETASEAETETETAVEAAAEAETASESETETETAVEAISEAEAVGEAETETETAGEAETETETMTAAGTDPARAADEPETGTEAETETESADETGTEAEIPVRAEAETEAETEADTETEAGTGTKAVTETGSETETETAVEAAAEAETASEAETETETAAGAETETETKFASETETEAETTPGSAKGTVLAEADASAVLAGLGNPDTSSVTGKASGTDGKDKDAEKETKASGDGNGTKKIYDRPVEKYASSSVNVRLGPGTGYGIVGELDQGEAVEVSGEKDGWYQVSYDGKTAYVSMDYLTEAYKPSYAYINSQCNCRSSAGYDGAVLGEFFAGERVEVLGGEGWIHVRSAESGGLEGYVGSKFVSME